MSAESYDEGLVWPRDGETLSSFVAAWRGQKRISVKAFETELTRVDPTVLYALAVDPDFPPHPSWRSAFSTVMGLPASAFAGMGTSAGTWRLMPRARRCACLECLREASTPAEQFGEESWTQSAITTCWIHGLPLIEVPAIGYGWADVSSSIRRVRGALMRAPEIHLDLLKSRWNQLHERVRTTIFFAELTCVSVCNSSPFLEKLGLKQSGSEDVWRDLLTLLCCSWLPEPAPAIAALGLPRRYQTEPHSLLRCRNRPVLIEDPTFDLFKALSDPLTRRVCMMIAFNAIRPDYAATPEKLRFRRWGWSAVVRQIPENGWQWLERQAHWWDHEWQSRFDQWSRLRQP
jgi:hypothetical protein